MTVAVAVAFVCLMATGWYAVQPPSGPSGSAYLMFLLLMIAMGILFLVTPITFVRWASAGGRGFGFKVLAAIVAVVLVGLIWTFVVWATDPNYPERLLRGRILFFAHSAALCFLNYYLIRRAGQPG